MHFVVEHRVIDRERLLSANVQEVMDGGPAGVQGLQTLVSADGAEVFCVWEAPSVEALRAYVDPSTVGILENTYHELDSDHSIGLPASVATQA